MGLDWNKIRKDYEARATPEELEPADWYDSKPKKRQQTRQSRATGSRNYARGPRVKKYDTEAIVRAYKDGKTTGEVAKEFGCSQETVRNYCVAAGVFDPTRDRGGSKPKDLCSKGHDYNKVGYYVTKKGGKDCRECKRERERASARRRREQLQRETME